MSSKTQAPAIECTPVESSTIDSVGYDSGSRTLRIQFQSGGVYDYNGVSEDEHKKLIAAGSIGSHFHRHIRGKHECVKLVGPRRAA